jgi:hypothetical protein
MVHTETSELYLSQLQGEVQTGRRKPMFYWPIEEYTVLENILIIVLPLGWCLFLRWFCDPERWKKRREAAKEKEDK